MESKELAVDEDVFSRRKFAWLWPCTTNGVRTTSPDFITRNNTKTNITILTSTVVDKIILARNSDGELRAVAVRANLDDGRTIEIACSRDVVVSGGAYCGPAIETRYGFGAQRELQKLGIPTFVDLLGVSKNLVDHLVSLTEWPCVVAANATND